MSGAVYAEFVLYFSLNQSHSHRKPRVVVLSAYGNDIEGFTSTSHKVHNVLDYGSEGLWN
jgi:hypothetical protein